MNGLNILQVLTKQPNALLILEKAKSYFEKERLERQKFHDSLHDDLNAEFINGKIVYQPLVAIEHLSVSASLHNYVTKKDYGEIGVEKVMISLSRNDYQPSICFFRKEKAVQFYAEQILFPAPDLVIEIVNAITEEVARTIKMQDYAAHGVQEYWLVDPVQQFIEQYLLEGKNFQLHAKLIAEGTIYAKAIEGYSINLKEVF